MQIICANYFNFHNELHGELTLNFKIEDYIKFYFYLTEFSALEQNVHQIFWKHVHTVTKLKISMRLQKSLSLLRYSRKCSEMETSLA